MMMTGNYFAGVIILPGQSFCQSELDVIAVGANVASPPPNRKKRCLRGADGVWLKWQMVDNIAKGMLAPCAIGGLPCGWPGQRQVNFFSGVTMAGVQNFRILK